MTAASATTGELNITPLLDIIVNLLLFLLVTTSCVLSVSHLDPRLPPLGPSTMRSPFALSVTLASDGTIFVSDGIDRPRALPPARSGHDLLALRALAATLHETHPGERTVALGADPQVPYDDLVAAMDALRGDRGAPVFDDVLLSATVR